MRKRIKVLINKHLEGVITAQEQIELKQYAAKSEYNDRFVSDLIYTIELLDKVKESYKWIRDGDLNRINK